jgi:hypothetical protein
MRVGCRYKYLVFTKLIIDVILASERKEPVYG